MLRKLAMNMIPQVRLFQYDTDFWKLISEEIVKNVKYVIKSLNFIVCHEYLLF